MLPVLRGRSHSQLNNYSHFRIMRQSIENQQMLNDMIMMKIGRYSKLKISSATPSHLNKSKKKLSDLKKTGSQVKTGNQNEQTLLGIKSLNDLITRQRLYHQYRQKLQMGFEQCFLFYMEIIAAAIKYECIISAEKIQKDLSPLIECFAFVAQSLFQIGYDKLAYFFGVKGITLCEFYQKYLQMGKFLYLLGKISRRLGRLEHSIIFLKKGLEYLWYERKQQAYDIEIEVYDQLSHNFLQMNMLDESKIFGEKYQIGYTEKNNSKIIELSKQLVSSLQRRKVMWHAITKQSMELLISFSIQEVNKKNSYYFSGRIDQKKVLDILKINFEYLWDNFLLDDMFFYEIPLPLELVITEKPKSFSRLKPAASSRFIVKKRSQSSDNLKVLNRDNKEKVKEFMIFNYRGVGVSKQKMANRLRDFIAKLKLILNKNAQ